MIGRATSVRVIAATVALLVLPVATLHARTTGPGDWPVTQALAGSELGRRMWRR